MIKPSLLLPEFDHETGATRRLLERLPEEQLDWRPHAKSWTLGELAGHVAQIPFWATSTLTTAELDLATTPRAEPVGSVAEILDRLDTMVAGAREVLASSDADSLAEPWTLRMGDDVLFTMPRLGVYRTMVMNHLIHHRGQLVVYLRLLDQPVPGLYGPSADEQGL